MSVRSLARSHTFECAHVARCGARRSEGDSRPADRQRMRARALHARSAISGVRREARRSGHSDWPRARWARRWPAGDRRLTAAPDWSIACRAETCCRLRGRSSGAPPARESDGAQSWAANCVRLARSLARSQAEPTRPVSGFIALARRAVRAQVCAPL